MNNRFYIDKGNVIRDIYGFIEPLPVSNELEAVKIKNLLNANWEQFQNLKLLMGKLKKENNKLKKINKNYQSLYEDKEFIKEQVVGERFI